MEQSVELPQMAEQLVDAPKIVVELTVSPGEAGSSRPEIDDTISTDGATATKAVGEARPLGIAEHSVTTASALAVFSGEAGSAPELAKSSGGVGPSWSRGNGVSIAATTADTKCLLM